MASNDPVNNVKVGGISNGVQEVEQMPSWKEQLEEKERKARVNAAWEKMNSGLPAKMPKTLMNLPSSKPNKHTQDSTPYWMVSLGLAPKKSPGSRETLGKRPANVASASGTSEEAKKLAAAALSAVKDATAAAAAGRGKIEITERRDFAGEDIEVKKFVDADSKEAAEKSKSSAPATAVDNILEQIKKKQKLSVLDKTKKDWGEFKEDKKLEEELDAYKKSSNQYLDKVSFLQRTDLREFERERDARLALQAKRRADMREDDL
ncbi:Uncharacterized protein M6B38_209920 [Iris pallida]|uniref:BCNT-C domain-containing protein n=1 Tax=Iris pallida TaxID=29817 RepID=A0AAX6E3P1_IRIPA|nr:Uncharacterized protein M6B38_209920 [Iris pallida]